MDRALDVAIRLFTRVLTDANVDVGALAIRGDVPANVTKTLADCTTFHGEADGGLSYLALGLTHDFKAMMYPPHCRLFLIINSTGICEDEHTQGFLAQLAPEQLPGPLIDAHMMRRWIHYILPTGQAMMQGKDALEALHRRLVEDLMEVVRSVPSALQQKVDLKAKFMEWVDGFPAVIGRPLTADVKRMNGLPVTEFIGETLTKFLADVQMRGLSERNPG
jgi:hypothetical protein